MRERLFVSCRLFVGHVFRRLAPLGGHRRPRDGLGEIRRPAQSTMSSGRGEHDEATDQADLQSLGGHLAVLGRHGKLLGRKR